MRATKKSTPKTYEIRKWTCTYCGMTVEQALAPMNWVKVTQKRAGKNGHVMWSMNHESYCSEHCMHRALELDCGFCN